MDETSVRNGPGLDAGSTPEQRPIRVLHVDDDPGFGDLTVTLLERESDRFTVTSAQSAAEGLERIAEESFDCIVSDYEMPGRNGIEFLTTIRERGIDLPFVLFTGKGSEEVASDAISAGVTDYLQKEAGSEQYAVLANRVQNVVEKHRAETDLERRTGQYEAVARLGRLALETDSLDELLETAATSLADRLGTDCAKILDRQADGTFLLVAGTGWQDGLVGAATVPGADSSQAGYTARQSEPVVVTDVETEARFDVEPLLTDHGIVCGISTVIGPPSDPWGILGAHSKREMAFSSRDVTFVQNVANVLAAAIERRTVEDLLRESETRFREIAELSPDGIFRADVNGVFQYVSPRSAELLDRPVTDIEGTNFRDYVVPESEADAVSGFARVLSGEVVRALELTLVDGSGENLVIEVSASPVFEDGEVVVVQGFARDISERRQRERELHLRRERYQRLVDHFPDGGVFRFDEECRYVLAGGQEIERVGLDSEDFIGATPADLFPPDIAAETEAYYRAALAGETNTFEQTYQGNHYRIQTIPIRDPDGNIDGGMAVSLNITEQVERERRLERQNDRLDELARLVSHDLRNPLNVATNRLEFARETCESEHLDAIASAHDRIESLVDDLLAAVIEGERPLAVESVDLRALAERCWETVTTGNATLVVETDRVVDADVDRLHRLCANLFQNAVRHGGADVTVTVGGLDDGGFYVADDGPGIPDADHETVFETGYSTADDGTGLGLYIVQTIAEEHGWTVSATDSAGGGARFEVRTGGS